MEIRSLDDCIAADHPVRLIDALVEKLDLKKLGIALPQATEGRPAFHPKILLKLYLYGYMNGIRTSRKLDRECARNLEVRWLLEELMPCYKTIADFRKDNPEQLKNVFRMFTVFLREQKLIEGEVIAVDGSKFRAVNSKKNNYNAEKISRQQDYINKNTEEYLRQLDENDKQEEPSALGGEIKREAIVEHLKKLKERELKYENLERQISGSEETQVSTTDSDSRALLISNNTVDVSYNVQTVSDEKHSLVGHFEVTNENDKQALHKTTSDAKEELQKESLTVLADKGYHTGAELARCEQENITTLVSPKESSAQNPDENYAVENFIYNKEADTYTCPAGETLTTNGNWYEKSHDDKKRKHGTRYKMKHYKTTACMTCAVMQLCTKNKRGRLIERSEHQESINRNNERVKAQHALYRRRQELIEHIFGTIKRQWGYTYTLLKGKKKITGEFSLIYLAYNFMRTKNILGFDKMMEALNNWTPKYPGNFVFLFFRLHPLQYERCRIFDFTVHPRKMAA